MRQTPELIGSTTASARRNEYHAPEASGSAVLLLPFLRDSILIDDADPLKESPKQSLARYADH